MNSDKACGEIIEERKGVAECETDLARLSVKINKKRKKIGLWEKERDICTLMAIVLSKVGKLVEDLDINKGDNEATDYSKASKRIADIVIDVLDICSKHGARVFWSKRIQVLIEEARKRKGGDDYRKFQTGFFSYLIMEISSSLSKIALSSLGDKTSLRVLADLVLWNCFLVAREIGADLIGIINGKLESEFLAEENSEEQ